MGTILAGVFTVGAISQLKSLGFSVLYFSYQDVMASFQTIGIDAQFDEQTTDANFEAKIQKWEELSPEQHLKLITGLLETNVLETERFINTLRIMVNRSIETIRILPLHGILYQCETIQQAIQYLEDYPTEGIIYPLIRFEVEIKYSNGDTVNNSFTDKEMIIRFLNSYFPTY